jgi:arginase family enzyme
MDIAFYFNEVDAQLMKNGKGDLGSLIEKHGDGELPSITEGVQIVLFGVGESRNALSNKGSEHGANYVRSYLYKLKKTSGFKLPVIDLGNILGGETVSDTYYAVSSVVAYLVKRNCIPVIIGGTQDLTYANYLAYENLEQVVNLTTIDRKFDMGVSQEEEINNENFLSKILLHQPNYLFHYTNIGNQSYFVDEDVKDLIDKLHFDELRLGLCRQDMKLVEPLVRNSDIVSFDMSSIKGSDSPGNEVAGPNGFTNDECCQVARYAGISEKVTSIGFYEYDPEFDHQGISAHVLAQMVWYFIDGVNSRKGDLPLMNSKNYLKYRVHIDSFDEDLVFLKSVKTDRWWMNVPFPSPKANRFKRHQLVPCSYEDYQEACKNEVPDLWLKTYQKFL